MSEIHLQVNGHEVRVPTGSIVAAAIALVGESVYHHSVNGEARAPLCGMGICGECRVIINGQDHHLSCQTICEEGMRIRTT